MTAALALRSYLGSPSLLELGLSGNVAEAQGSASLVSLASILAVGGSLVFVLCMVCLSL